MTATTLPYHTRICRSCNRPRSSRGNSFGIYCNAWASRARRHGHPEQQSLTFAKLKPFLALVKRYRKRNKHLDWTAIHARWDLVVSMAKDTLIDAQGKATYAPQRQAAEAIVRLAQNVEAAKLVDYCIAVYLHADTDQRFYRTDESFNDAQRAV